MRFLLDQNLPIVLAHWLLERGYPCEHVRLLGLAEAADGAILARALATQAVLVSKDADFAATRIDALQLVWVRIGNTTNDRLLAEWTAAWPHLHAALSSGERVVELGRA